MKTMKRITTLMMIAALVVINMACSEEEPFDTTPPAAPRNVQTFVGDNRVDITWNHNTESDLAGYNVYFAWEYDGRYEIIGSTNYDENYFIDYEARNGEKYYYAVVAFDANHNESDLSSAEVYGAPRPEGFDQTVFDYLIFPESAGYDFSEYSIVKFNDADFFFENFEGIFYLNVWGTDTDIQDMGLTNNIYDIEFAPNDGWVPMDPDLGRKYVEAVVGHTYVIWTWDNHFAKVRISGITNERMVFDWSYQTIEGEGQLKRGSKESRESVSEEVIKLRR